MSLLKKHHLDKLTKLEDSTNEAIANLLQEPVEDLTKYGVLMYSDQLKDGVEKRIVFKKNVRAVKRDAMQLAEFYGLTSVTIKISKL